MSNPRKFMDDLAQVMGSSYEVVAGFKGEVDKIVKHQVQAVLKQGGFVTREEFEVVKAMAAKAREEQERLQVIIEGLERQLNNKG